MDFIRTPLSLDAPATSHINTLPNEVLENVLSLLPPGDQLEARAVCRRWAQVVSGTHFLTSPNITTFDLSPGTNSYSTFLASECFWKRVQITGLVSTPESEDWFRALAIRSTVRRLVFRNCVFRMEFLQSSVLEFPRLEELEFINSKTDLHWNEEPISKEVEEPWKEFLRTRLKSLTIEVGEAGVLMQFLGMFECTDSCMRRLVVRSTYSFEFYTLMHVLHQGNYYRELGSLEKILRNSSSNLREFSLTIRTPRSAEDFWPHFPWDCLRMQERRFHTFDLIFLNPDSRPTTIDGCNDVLPEFLTFVRSQPDLTSLTLPPVTDRTKFPELIDSLPRHLESIGIGSVNIFRQPEFIQKIEKVKDMTLSFFQNIYTDFNAENIIEDFHAGLLGRVLPEVRTLTLYGRPGGLGLTLANSFPNLKALVMTCFSAEASADTVNDTELQIIISAFPRLTVLKLSSCDRITDFGVSGIRKKEAAKVMRGLRLQDLQDLEELALEGSSQISDIGVQYGLGFKKLRKLDMATGNQELTEWGVLRLAEMNPRLERMHVEACNLENPPSIEKAIVTQLKSNGSGTFRRIQVSLKHNSTCPIPT